MIKLMQVFHAPYIPFGNAFEEEFFCGKTFGFRAQIIASVACQQKRRENAAASDFVDKSLVKSVGHV